MAGKAIPNPGDFVAPGSPLGVEDVKPVNDDVFQKMKAELEKEGVFTEAAQEPIEKKRTQQPTRPVQFSLSSDPFLPIEEKGCEDIHTLVFLIRDNRPNVVVPLFGPGSYMITIRRTVEA